MVKKKGKKKKEEKKKPVVKVGSKTLKNPKEELFAHLYSGHHNAKLFGNGTQCYSLAYGYEDKIEKVLEQIEKLEKDASAGYTVKVSALKTENKKTMKVSATLSCRLLIKVDIIDRINYLMDTKLLSDEHMDRELSYTASQRKDLNSKVQAIREINKVRGRITEKIVKDVQYSWKDENDDDDE